MLAVCVQARGLSTKQLDEDVDLAQFAKRDWMGVLRLRLREAEKEDEVEEVLAARPQDRDEKRHEEDDGGQGGVQQWALGQNSSTDKLTRQTSIARCRISPNSNAPARREASSSPSTSQRCGASTPSAQHDRGREKALASHEAVVTGQLIASHEPTTSPSESRWRRSPPSLSLRSSLSLSPCSSPALLRRSPSLLRRSEPVHMACPTFVYSYLHPAHSARADFMALADPVPVASHASESTAPAAPVEVGREL